MPLSVIYAPTWNRIDLLKNHGGRVERCSRWFVYAEQTKRHSRFGISIIFRCARKPLIFVLTRRENELGRERWSRNTICITIKECKFGECPIFNQVVAPSAHTPAHEFQRAHSKERPQTNCETGKIMRIINPTLSSVYIHNIPKSILWTAVGLLIYYAKWKKRSIMMYFSTLEHHFFQLLLSEYFCGPLAASKRIFYGIMPPVSVKMKI